jgi:hypothetical protein
MASAEKGLWLNAEFSEEPRFAVSGCPKGPSAVLEYVCAVKFTCILISGITTVLIGKIDYTIVIALPQRTGAVQQELNRAEV